VRSSPARIEFLLEQLRLGELAAARKVFAEENSIELSPYGSWTFKHPELAGAEPDQSYIVGEDLTK
jgi:hypothetical protein